MICEKNKEKPLERFKKADKEILGIYLSWLIIIFNQYDEYRTFKICHERDM